MDRGAESYRRYLAGEDVGMRELIELYNDGLILYLNTYTRDLNAAEALAEDTFVRLAVKRPRYSGKASFKTWLYTIARHLAVDALRRQARRKTVSLEDIDDPAEVQTPEGRVLTGERDLRLHRAMQTLSGDHRQILWLVYFEGMSAAEAAKVMGRSTRAAQSLLFRAKQALKTQLERDGFSDEDL